MGAHSGDGDALSAGGPGAGVLALTFDDGPAPGNDSEILRLLARHGAVATFFVIGSAIGAHFELLERMVAAGCEIGNHSWSHAVLPGLPPGVQRGEVRATNEVLAGIGIRPRWFRPPYGRTGAETEAIARAEGLESILWSLDSQDWTGHGADGDRGPCFRRRDPAAQHRRQFGGGAAAHPRARRRPGLPLRHA